MTRFLGAALIAASTLLAACSTTSPDVFRPGDAQRLSTVQDAVVLNVRPVVVEGQQSGVGGVSGAVVGGIAGSTVGGRREAAAIGVIGAVAGAVIGNTIERFGTREEGSRSCCNCPPASAARWCRPRATRPSCRASRSSW